MAVTNYFPNGVRSVGPGHICCPHQTPLSLSVGLGALFLLTLRPEACSRIGQNGFSGGDIFKMQHIIDEYDSINLDGAHYCIWPKSTLHILGLRSLFIHGKSIAFAFKLSTTLVGFLLTSPLLSYCLSVGRFVTRGKRFGCREVMKFPVSVVWRGIYATIVLRFGFDILDAPNPLRAIGWWKIEVVKFHLFEFSQLLSILI